jgi:hypothetical protein
MTAEQLFNIANIVAIAGWLVLVFVPGNRMLVEGVARGLVPALLSVAYAVILVPFIFGGGFGSLGLLEGIAATLGQPWLLLAGWLHYLAFDLLVGGWEVATAREEGISHYALLPCLLFTFLLGPIGFLGFLMLRWTVGRRA